MSFAEILPLAFVMIAGPQIISAFFFATSDNWAKNSLAYLAVGAASITTFVTIADVGKGTKSGQADQRLVLARVEPAVLHLDIVSPLVSFRFAVCSDVESRMESQILREGAQRSGRRLLLSHDLGAAGLRSHIKRRGGTMATSVRDAMTENPRSIGQSASVVEAARLMREEHIGSLPITDDEKLVGMITDRDITTRVVAEAGDPKTTSVGDVYSRDLISVAPDKDLEEALQLMARHQVRRLPVVENGRLVGIVAQADIALTEKEKKTGELVEAISKPSEGERR
jgi:CBS domain-containing protein